MARSLWPESSGATSGSRRAQVGREVDVHVADDPRVAARPGLAQRAAAALAIEAQQLDAAAARARAPRAMAGVASVLALSAMTIRQENGKLGAQEAVQPADAALQRGLLVEDRDDDLDARRGAGGTRRAPAHRGPGERLLGHGHSVGARRGTAMGAAESRLGVASLRRRAAGSGRRSCAPPPGALPARTSPPCASTIAGDDREAEAGAAAAALAPALRAPEALEQRVGVARSAGRGRGRGPRGARRRRRAQRHLDRRPGGRVHERVAQQVAEHLAQLVGRRRRPAPAVDVAGRSRGPGAVARASSTASRASAARSSLGVRRVGDLVQARERQQVLDEHAHARRLVLDAAHRLLDVRGLARGAHAEQLGVAADRGQRRAQLVRGVGDEAPQAVLAGLRARRTRARGGRASR